MQKFKQIIQYEHVHADKFEYLQKLIKFLETESKRKTLSPITIKMFELLMENPPTN